MKKTCLSGLSVLLQLNSVLAAPSRPSLSSQPPIRRQGNGAAAGAKVPSCNADGGKTCWQDGFDVNTDYEFDVPQTGVTAQFEFVVDEVDNWVAGDGTVKEKAMLINGQFPGPTIKANWGDMIEITVKNNMRTNGTSLHWHGIRMLNNSVMDGTNGVTECPTAPGQSKTYRFLAEQYGTSWYHSHFSSQYANGATGAIQIDGPASADYDIDLGVLHMSDWYVLAADHIQHGLNAAPGPPPPSTNFLFNGKHVNAQGGGEYMRATLEPGKRHRLRLINPSVDNTFTVSLVGHQMTVIATDFVPVVPETVDSLYMAVGQRYDVIIDASQPVDHYWLNATADGSGLCGAFNAEIPHPAAIFSYDGVAGDDAAALPSNPGTPPPASACSDRLGWQPLVKRTAPSADFAATDANDVPIKLDPDSATVTWDVKGQSFNISWDEPTLEFVSKGVTDFPGRYNIISNPDENEWSFWVIQNLGSLPHPIHLHGHDFLILGRSSLVDDPTSVTEDMFYSTLAFNAGGRNDAASLNFDNPTRRDTTMLPAWGWAVIAFRTDNPGAWLFHCHIAWHASQGLGVQFLERLGDIPADVALSNLEPTCETWTEYWNEAKPNKYDSGV